MSSEQVESVATANNYDNFSALQNKLSQLLAEEFPEKERCDNVMFDKSILLAVQNKGRIPELPVGFSLRPLQAEDCQKGYFELLGQGCSSRQISVAAFKEKFHEMRRTQPLSVYTIVIENNQSRIVGTASLVVEFKYIHKLGARGRVKDLVIHADVRRQRFGSILNYYMIEIALQIGVYKISLECRDELVDYFERFGFIKDPDNNVMYLEFNAIEEKQKIKDNGQSIKCHRESCHNGDCDSSSKYLYSEVESELFSEGILRSFFDGTIEIPENFRLRPLNIGDYKRGFLKLLEQLTLVGEISEMDFQKRFRLMRNYATSKYLVVVVEDCLSQRVVGSATLFLDRHGFGTHGHVEDVVVDSGSRGKKLGHLLNICLIELARRLSADLLTLECRDRLLTFYKQFGYKKRDNFMVKRFDK